MDPKTLDRIIPVLKKEYGKWKEPIVTKLARKKKDPFKVLISTMLSLRTKDYVTKEASERLYKLADTPEDMLKLSEDTISKAIHPVGFSKTKAGNILEVCKTLIDDYSGKVPDDLDELLKLRGVGRKTANLVVTLGYGKPGICVDTHVHRISNRFGLVSTKNPDKTEFALREILPKKYWIEYNSLLVAYGQNLCTPISPHCSRCKIEKYCEKVGVEKHR
jgi:endonuclease-3